MAEIFDADKYDQFAHLSWITLDLNWELTYIFVFERFQGTKVIGSKFDKEHIQSFQAGKNWHKTKPLFASSSYHQYVCSEFLPTHIEHFVMMMPSLLLLKLNWLGGFLRGVISGLEQQCTAVLR